MSNATSLPPNSGGWMFLPVMFPPGRARLATSPLPTGSDAAIITTGMELVACLTARISAMKAGRMTATLNRTRSAARSGRRAMFPSASAIRSGGSAPRRRRSRPRHRRRARRSGGAPGRGVESREQGAGSSRSSRAHGVAREAHHVSLRGCERSRPPAQLNPPRAPDLARSTSAPVNSGVAGARFAVSYALKGRRRHNRPLSALVAPLPASAGGLAARPPRHRERAARMRVDQSRSLWRYTLLSIREKKS